MRILLTNDDGIDAIGLKNLYSIISKFDFVTEIWVVAPKFDKSCCSHSMSFKQPITVCKKSDREFAISGTPVDCVVIAVQDLMKEYKPDMIISGINIGANMGVDTLYSGTVSAAREGSLQNIPSIAISQLYSKTGHIKWQHTHKLFTQLISNLMVSHQNQKIYKERTLISINLPYQDVIGIKYLAQGHHYLGNHISSTNTEDNSNTTTHVIGTNKIEINSNALKQGYIAVTPLGVDLTDYGVLNYLQEHN